ncbi:ABC transporter permease [Mucilaginibacter gotjawali]|uniref:Permease n=2 Tax=Mucilaginibacter gotjawali TaxID=1550579 RepID=A0A839SIW9_9SPHI|nr:ABC transporter permease [Mucilaginibacter gotjawali]MBB3056509.1 putative permease [Mucilaginibacter gotjawali]BAU52789.1 putative ABC transporter permease YknZ [Mucilaginibacter gotjawali]
MIKNYFKTAWRSLRRNKSYATINIAGLSIGIAACLLIFLVVQYETSFDNFHANKDHIYRVCTLSKDPDGNHLESGLPLPVAEGLRIDFPELKQVAGILRNDGSHYSIQNADGTKKKFKEDDAYYCEPQFYSIFNFGWLAGNKKTALAEPNTVVLSEDEGNRFFGDWHKAMGKIVRYENKTDLKVTGIVKNSPANTDFPIRLLISFATDRQPGSDNYSNLKDWVSTFGDNSCFVVLPGNMPVSKFNADLVAMAKRRKPAPYNTSQVFTLQPLADMHYSTETGVYSGHTFSKQLIDVISLIGLFLLIIACVNFINLATAQAVNRSKEVGIRKVLGSNRKQLAVQFITETFLITLFAVLLAIGVAQAALPFLNQLLDIKLSSAFLAEPVLWLFLAGTMVLVTLLSGLYPAAVISGFNPITALKNRVMSRRATGISLRQVLVVFQFCIAQVLVIGTLVVVYQMQYFHNKSLGFNKDAIVNVSFPGDSLSRSKLKTMRDELLQQPGITEVSYSFASPSDNNGWGSDFKYNNAPQQTKFNASLKWADANYFKLYGLKFVAGGPYKTSDTLSGWVVNETMLAKLGVTDPEKAIGKYIKLWDDPHKNFQIVGVIKDFNVRSLKDAIPPVLMGSWNAVYQRINIKISPQNVNQTLAGIERIWNQSFPDGIYEYQFLDKKIADFYKSEDQLSQLYKIFAGISIFISCLGLYGLISFMVVQRIKEVGIRKTLGASVGNIVYLFSKEFTVLIIIAFAISAPLGWFGMNKWFLQGYTYKITIGPGIFLLAILASVSIAWITVGYKAVRAALTNPVESLRSE